MTRSRISRFGSHPAGLWLIKHVISPMDRFVVRRSGGRLPPPSSLAVPTLFLLVVGRRSGEVRTMPLVYVRDGERFIVCNARPPGERRNPWVLNLRAAGRAQVRVGRQVTAVNAIELDEEAVDRWWPALVAVWPAFSDQYTATGERTVFTLEPTTPDLRVQSCDTED